MPESKMIDMQGFFTLEGDDALRWLLQFGHDADTLAGMDTTQLNNLLISSYAGRHAAA